MIFDTPDNVTSKLPNLVRNGVTTVIRYLTTSTQSEKCIKVSEARSIAASGLRLGLVFEVWGGSASFSHHDINAESGAAHAGFANQWMPNIGAPQGAACYFAIDTDASDLQIQGLIVPYFKSVKAQLNPKYRVGAYACGAALDVLLRKELIVLAWLPNAMGWHGSKQFRDAKRWNLLQRLPTTYQGLDIDPDDVLPMTNGSRPDIGDFIPFGAATPIPLPSPSTPVHDAFWLQNRLNVLGANPQLKVDGDIGPASVAAIEPYLPKE